MIGSPPDRYARLVVSAVHTCLFALLALSVVGATGGGSGLATPVAAVPAAQVPGEGDLDLPAQEGPEDDLPVQPAPTEAAETVPAADLETESDGSVDAENRRILLIVLGLVAVAIAITLLTIRYWRQTRPVPVADESVSAGRADSDRRSDPVPEARAPDGGAYSELFEPVAVPARRSRRAVAGADHAGADDLWVPRGTGEHDRVEVSEAPVISKPTTDQRAAALNAGRRR